tara:strand:- start:31 stop:426 length:396 start_codon:yes stop_codon:yes gene_type:complete
MPKSKKQINLGPNAERFADHLSLGIDCFQLDIDDYIPTIVSHDEHGPGFLISQLSLVDHERDYCARHTIVATESGVVWADSAVTKNTIVFNEDQPPEKAALLVLSAIVRKVPLVAPSCPCCEEESKEACEV